ncbi:MAG: hypothetical protein RL318_2681, partial [Fibrobacterota bacterium]
MVPMNRLLEMFRSWNCARILGMPAKWFAIAIPAGLVLNVLLFWWVGVLELDAQKLRIYLLASDIAHTLPSQRIAELKGDSTDLTSPSYRQIKAELRIQRHNARGIRFLYLLRKQGDRILFLADSEDSGSVEESPPGQVYSEASAGLKAAFDHKTDLVEGPFEDRWGDWYTGLAPVLDSRDGTLLGFFGMDQSSHVVEQAVLHERLKFLCLSFLIWTIAFMALWLKHRYEAEIHDSGSGRRIARRGTPLLAATLGLCITGYLAIDRWDASKLKMRNIVRQRSAAVISQIQAAIERRDHRLSEIARDVGIDPRFDPGDFADALNSSDAGTSGMLEMAWMATGQAAPLHGVSCGNRWHALSGKMGDSIRVQAYFHRISLKWMDTCIESTSDSLISDMRRNDLMGMARGEHRVISSELFPSRDGVESPKFLVFEPIFRNDGVRDSSKVDRHKQFVGFLQGTYSLSFFLEIQMRRIPSADIGVSVQQMNHDSMGLMWKYSSPLSKINWSDTEYSHHQMISQGGQGWLITVNPGRDFLSQAKSNGHWWILFSGLFLSGLLAWAVERNLTE